LKARLRLFVEVERFAGEGRQGQQLVDLGELDLQED